ncbi:glutamate 5-kinase [Propionicimonas sp.]|uniref:glutamate 5-kinase n=1 Tax=Propionicimonas sp. TaxID=1955623 RepID=UPI001795CECB|nr:glutamate 5-kinase [Propionicimonas sp.]MBU3975978.1 glutamate 5-kinase [Actinomycetota bacterium]MBA3020793.1 glutamate 5-kinase [Propionicimonas sp.]MBU3985168.1 glutamate 5-kinase [Actinomycetota bacterium]MBU4008158.1 glutamate 5-kinase [Actinomycetota bacterium]MBU4064628.1 glutamate 5-kinase [Actinomycetota bacterium]
MTEGLREQITGARRLLVKVGSSSLTDASGALDPSLLERLVESLAAVRERGQDVVLVSSGAMASGMEPLKLKRRPADLASKQAAAAVGQSLLVGHYGTFFGRHGLTVGQVLLTVEDVARQDHYRNALRTFTKLLELGVVPIVNENDTVATHEIRFGDNDRLAALVAHLVGADALVLLSDVDSLYTAHPSTPGAERISVVADIDELDVDTDGQGAAIGTGGMTTKLQAARIATASGIPVVLASAQDATAALAGEPVGTLFLPTGKRRSRKLMWLAYASVTQGELVLDPGAVKAVTERKASLLPAGIVEVRGQFEAGDPVKLVSQTGQVVARGLVNFDADKLPAMIGRSTKELAESLGEHFDREVVHRDDLIVKRTKKKL